MSDLAPNAQQWINVILIWLGFGIVTGLLAQALVPGRQTAGVVGTLVVGVVGSAAGPLLLSLLVSRPNFNPISPLGLLAAVAGAVVLLIGQRIATAYSGVREADDAGE